MSYTVGAVQSERSLTQIERDNLFYLLMSIACAGGIFLGFSRTFYLKTYFGTPALPALFVFHGVEWRTGRNGINTGRTVLARASYLYDAGMGRIGFRVLT